MANGKLSVPANMRQYCDCINCNPWRDCSDEEFNEALGLANASFFSRQYDLQDEDLDRIIVQGSPLRYWLNKLNATKGDNNVESKRA